MKFTPIKLSNTNKKAIREWVDDSNNTRHEPAVGAEFSLQHKEKNKATGIKDRSDVVVPYDSLGNVNDAITQSTHSMFVGNPQEAYDFILRMPSARFHNTSSVYILNDGRIAVMRPHTHDETAASVLGHRLVPEEYDSDGHFIRNEVRSPLMPLYAGALRCQIYTDGIGVTVDMARKPNEKQLQSIRRLYESTPQKRFTAEVKWNRDFRGTIDNDINDFEDYIRTFVPLPNGPPTGNREQAPQSLVDKVRALQKDKGVEFRKLPKGIMVTVDIARAIITDFDLGVIEDYYSSTDERTFVGRIIRKGKEIGTFLDFNEFNVYLRNLRIPIEDVNETWLGNQKLAQKTTIEQWIDSAIDKWLF